MVLLVVAMVLLLSLLCYSLLLGGCLTQMLYWHDIGMQLLKGSEEFFTCFYVVV